MRWAGRAQLFAHIRRQDQNPTGRKGNLRRLALRSRPRRPADDTMAVLIELKSLETLQLDEARLSGTALAKLKQLPKLKRLTLHVIDIPETDVEALRGQLAGVDVKWDRPDEKGMKYIRRFFDPK